MNQASNIELDAKQQEYVQKIRGAIIEKQGVSFVYKRQDGETSTHNAVYPRQLFRRKGRFYVRAHCYFSGDTRLFRLDRIKSLEVTPKRKPLTRLQEILGPVFGIAFLLLVFVFFLLFSHKYSWRNLRRYIFTYLGIE